jgi:PEP-CTERM motif-containing protein
MNRKLPLLTLLLFALSAPNAHAGFMMHFEVAQTGSAFRYTIFNDEPTTSSLYISAFHLTADAPFTVTSMPVGWDFFTDNSTYIDWFNTDPELPYPHDVAPGNSLDGFTFLSTVTTTALQPFAANSWNHATDEGGPVFQGQVPAPFAFTQAVPEPATLISLGTGLMMLAGFIWYRRRSPSQ